MSQQQNPDGMGLNEDGAMTSTHVADFSPPANREALRCKPSMLEKPNAVPQDLNYSCDRPNFNQRERAVDVANVGDNGQAVGNKQRLEGCSSPSIDDDKEQVEGEVHSSATDRQTNQKDFLGESGALGIGRGMHQRESNNSPRIIEEGTEYIQSVASPPMQRTHDTATRLLKVTAHSIQFSPMDTHNTSMSDALGERSEGLGRGNNVEEEQQTSNNQDQAEDILINRWDTKPGFGNGATDGLSGDAVTMREEKDGKEGGKKRSRPISELPGQTKVKMPAVTFPSFSQPLQAVAAINPLHKMVQHGTSIAPKPRSQPTSPGIFDDAEEDDTFDLTRYKTMAPVSNKSIRPDLVGAIAGNHHGVPMQQAIEDSVRPSRKREKKAKRRPSKPTRRVLIGKKEKEFVEDLMAGKTDLLRILPREDCLFLGAEMWIFTLQQLELLLFDARTPGRPEKTAEATRASREELVQRLEMWLSKAKTTDTKNLTEEMKKNPSAVESVPFKAPSLSNRPPEAVIGSQPETEQTVDEKNESIPNEQPSTAHGRGELVERSRKMSSDGTVSSLVERRLAHWRTLITQWQRDKVDTTDLVQTQFPLDGPVSCLFSKNALNFVLSIDLKSAYDFMRRKRTETGLIVQIYRQWREQCGLKSMETLALAKHLIGIGQRIAVAIGSSAPPEKNTRAWMGGPMVVLTGQGKDFIITAMQIYSAEEFICRRTKELADMLFDWRESQGLPTLRGTGKVAMISAWKAVIKEAMDVQSGEGAVLKEMKLAEEASNESTAQPATKKRKTAPRTRRKATKPAKELDTVDFDKGIASTMFLSNVLRGKVADTLMTAGIETAAQLLTANTDKGSPLMRAAANIARSSPGTAASHEVLLSLVHEWCHRVKGLLVPKARDKKEKPTAGAANRVPRLKGTGKVVRARKSQPKVPWDSLSKSTKSFLVSIGISTAEDFLSSRTTDVANEYITWRESQGMAVLKGLGGVASVSGWKAQVKKALKTIDESDSIILSQSQLKQSSPSKPKLNNDNKRTRTLKEPMIKDASDRAVLFGLPKNRFSVLGATGSFSYHFELSVRKSSNQPSQAGLFLTYLGNSREEACCKPVLSQSKPSLGRRSLPILNPHAANLTQPYLTDPFCTSKADCGVIRLSEYGVLPMPRSDEYSITKEVVGRFVEGREKYRHEEYRSAAKASSNQYNVFKCPNDTTKDYFLHLNGPIETGQTVELVFFPSLPSSRDSEMRLWIEDQVKQLTLKELRSLLDHLNDGIGITVYRDVQRLLEKGETDLARGPESTTKSLQTLLLSRRRMHWLVLRINTQLQKKLQQDGRRGANVIMPTVALAPVWTDDFVGRLKRIQVWETSCRDALLDEATREIIGECSSSRFGDFVTTASQWCPLAQELFDNTMDLFARFAVELQTFCSEEKLVEDVCRIAQEASSKVLHVRKTKPFVNLDPTVLAALSLGEHGHVPETNHSLPVGSDRTAATVQLYTEAMALCDEPPNKYSLPSVSRQTRIATTTEDSSGLTTSGNEGCRVRTVEEMIQNNETIDVQWYVERQILAVVETVALASAANVAQYVGTNMSGLTAKIRQAVQDVVNIEDLKAPQLFPKEETRTKERVEIPVELLAKNERQEFHPISQQFFLALVWPTLRVAGFKLEAGESTDTLGFLPPGRKKDARTRMVKQEAARRRSIVAKKTNDLGLGPVPKSIKRLIISCSTVGTARRSESRGSTVSAVLRNFFAAKQQHFRDDDNGTGRLRSLVDAITVIFDKLAPKLLYNEELENFNVDDDKPMSETLGCECLMRLLFLVPSLTYQSDLPVQQVEDTVGVTRELMDYLLVHHQEELEASLHLPHEDYDEEYSAKHQHYISSRLRETSSVDPPSNGLNSSVMVDDLKEIVTPQDRPDLTDFIACVMDQVVVCRATHEEVAKKTRRVQVGYPGFVCKHCFGLSGEGKYFFGNIDSLTTAATVIEKHLLKCTKISQDLKSNLVRSRSRHAEQRKNTPQGSQAAFFARLWERLRLLRTSGGTEANMYVSLSVSSGDQMAVSEEDIPSGDGLESESGGREFSCHIQLIQYLKTTSPWKDKVEIQEAMNQYYRCLEYGGRIYNTNAMPLHFSSEWLLSKLAPRGNFGE